MNLWTISSVLVFISSIVFAIFVTVKGGNKRLSRIWTFFCLAVALWGGGGAFVSIADSKDSAFFWWRICICGVVLIPVFYAHFVHALSKKTNHAVVSIAYLSALFFLGYNFVTPYFVGSLKIVFDEFYWMDWRQGRDLVYLSFYIAFYWLLLSYSFLILIKLFLESSGIERNRYKYFIIGSLVGWVGGEANFLPTFGVNLYPYFNFLIFLYVAIFVYAMVKYRLMDISLIVTRTSIFIIVYSFILGIPFALAFGLKSYLSSLFGENWWIIPLIASTLLGTAGPYLYFFIQRKTEEKLLADQKRYQSTLKQASAGMTRIKDLKKLLNLIVYILSRTVNLTHAFLYLYNPKSRDYTLEAARGEKLSEKNYYISRRSALIDYLEKARLPIVAEEVKQQSQDYNNENLKEVCAQLKEIGAEVAVPILTEKRLLAIGVLGKKKTGSMYTPDDLTVFSILASQVALAIENAQFYEESKQTQEQLFQAEKMATIGTMADGLSHQINNRLHTLGFIAGDALDTINLSKDVQDPSKFQAILAEISKALAKIQDNVRQGGEIVQGLLRYTRKGQEGFGEVVFDKLVDEVVEMAQFKIKKEYVAIVKDYPQELPAIHGNFTQLQEVFFNIIDNAYDAIMQKKHEIADENFTGKIKISTRQTEKFLEVNVLDNGMGVKEDDQTKLFTPFFTTKVSSRKGTGLGLYVIKKIVEDNHQGEVFISSEHKIGTLFVVRLPMGKSA